VLGSSRYPCSYPVAFLDHILYYEVHVRESAAKHLGYLGYLVINATFMRSAWRGRVIDVVRMVQLGDDVDVASVNYLFYEAAVYLLVGRFRHWM
jgi:hypothetical protein